MSGRPHVESERTSSQTSNNVVKSLTATILAEINSATKRKEKAEKSFVCHGDLKDIWSDASRISTLLQSNGLSPHQIDFIQRYMIMILSTLILVGAADCLANFRARFFDSYTGEALVTDEGIPFEMSQLDDLELGPALQQRFYEFQFRFKPLVIVVQKGQKSQVIKNPMIRLPFEYRQKNIGSGGYGKVDHIGISPRHFKGETGSIWETVYEVACKKIKLPKDFDQEVDNLEILTESLTHHDRIMLHLTTIEHGPNRYILLPYARHYDLELFLHCGIGPDGKKKYDFDANFSKARNGDITPDLLTECWSLAHALDWLHNEITVKKSSTRIFCAHMDLKPANILIQHDPGSTVGKWVISDFGISVLREKTAHDSEIVSIGDYYSQLTVHTRPKRHEGTYQAPEVKLTDTGSKQLSNLTPDEKRIGRKSDVWSLGCILSEVLAFARGRDKAVCNFQQARTTPDGKDYFYVETTETADKDFLKAPNNKTKQYETHPAVILWLDGLCGSEEWVDCCVKVIKKILVVDISKRPGARELLSLIKSVKDHVDSPRTNQTVLRSNDEAIMQGTEYPLIVSQNPINASSNPMMGGVIDTDNVKEMAPDSRDDISLAHAMSLKSKVSSGTSSLVSTTFVKPASAHGIMIDSDFPRTPIKSTWIKLSRPKGLSFKVSSIALTHSESGVCAAYLTKSSVYFYELKVKEISASFKSEVPLPQTTGWRGIAVAGFFLAAWGYSTQKLLHVCDIREHQRRIELPPCDINMLERVVVSRQGAAALLCREQILVLKIDTQTLSPPLVAKDDQKFTDVAFNDTGELMFAWAFGQLNSLYVWRCHDCVVNEKPEYESNFRMEKKGDPSLTRVIPYNTYPGCIISTPDKRYFPARIRSAPRRASQEQSYDYEVKIFNAIAEDMFHDHSIITLEKDFPRSSLKEYKIEYDNNHHLLRSPGERICKLKLRHAASSRLLVTKYEDDIVAVICNINLKVEFVKIVPIRRSIS